MVPEEVVGKPPLYRGQCRPVLLQTPAWLAGAQHRQLWPQSAHVRAPPVTIEEVEDAWHVSNALRPYAELQTRAGPATDLCHPTVKLRAPF